MNTQNTALERHASAILGLVFVTMISMGLNAYFKPQKPVMEYLMPVSDWQFSDKFVQVSLAGKKVRECPIIDESWIGKAMINGKLVENIEFYWVKSKEASNDSFPPGYIYPVPGRWVIDNSLEATKMGLELDHDCGGITVPSSYWYDLPHISNRVAYEAKQ